MWTFARWIAAWPDSWFAGLVAMLVLGIIASIVLLARPVKWPSREGGFRWGS